MLTILGRDNSINVRKVMWTCAEIGLPFTLEPWGAGVRATQEASFLTLNPNGFVPVMRESGPEGDFVLWESNTICRYLAAEHGRDDLLPSQPRARAQVEQWMDWMAGELNNAWRYAFMALVRKHPAYTDKAQIAQSIANWNNHIALLDRQLQSTGAFVTGANFTLADLVLGLAVQRWLMTPIERPAFGALTQFHARLLERPGFCTWGANGVP